MLDGLMLEEVSGIEEGLTLHAGGELRPKQVFELGPGGHEDEGIAVCGQFSDGVVVLDGQVRELAHCAGYGDGVVGAEVYAAAKEE